MHEESIDVVVEVTGYKAKCSCGWVGLEQETAEGANKEFLIHYSSQGGSLLP